MIYQSPITSNLHELEKSNIDLAGNIHSFRAGKYDLPIGQGISGVDYGEKKFNKKEIKNININLVFDE